MQKLKTLSYTKINTYSDCSLKYMFRYIDKIPVKDEGSIALDFGNSIHKGLEDFHSAITDHWHPDLDVLLDGFEKDWENRILFSKYEFNKEEADHHREMGRVFMTKYFNEHKGTQWFSKPYLVEKLIKIPLINLSTGEIVIDDDDAELSVWVKCDLILRYRGPEDKTDKIYIIDHKGVSRDYSERKVMTDMQLTVYNHALKYIIEDGMVNNEDNLPIGVGYNLFIKTKEPKIRQKLSSRTDEDINRLLLIARSASNGINKKIFIPNENSWCDYCDFQEPCQAWGKFGDRWKEEYLKGIK